MFPLAERCFAFSRIVSIGILRRLRDARVTFVAAMVMASSLLGFNSSGRNSGDAEASGDGLDGLDGPGSLAGRMAGNVSAKEKASISNYNRSIR